MKLLYIVNVGNRFNSFSYSSSQAAKKLGIEFHIAGCWTDYNDIAEKLADEEKYGIKIHQVDFIRRPYDPRNIKAYRQIVNLIQKEKFDFIHCNTPIGGLIGRLAGAKCRITPIIYQAHGFHFFKGAPLFNWLVYYPIEKWLAHKTDALVTINREDYELAQTFNLRRKGNVYYIPGVGIDTNEFKTVGIDRLAKRKELGIENDEIVLISTGELNSNKNNKVIIKALLELSDPKIHYLICGEGILNDQLEQLAKPLNNRVHFLGFRTDIKELLAISDIFVMPSIREGLSRSLMEAMASGLPCIVSNIRGNTDLIENGKGGILCYPKDERAFGKAIKTLGYDKVLMHEMSLYNLDKIKEFDSSVVERDMAKLYSEVLF